MKRDPMAGGWIVQVMIIALILLIIGEALGIRVTWISALGALAASGAAFVVGHLFWRSRGDRSFW